MKKIIWMMSFSKALLQPYIMEREAGEFSVKFLWTNFCQLFFSLSPANNFCHPAEAAWAADSAGPHQHQLPQAALQCQQDLSTHVKAIPKDPQWAVLTSVLPAQTSPLNVRCGAESRNCLQGHSSNIIIHNRDARKQKRPGEWEKHREPG